MANFKIIADESDYIVALKPHNLGFHSESDKGFVVLLEEQLSIKLYAVHRLDKVTSGIIILAKSSNAAAQFTALFTAHKVNKFYLALIDTKPKKKQGWIKGDMDKSRRGTFKLLKTNLNPAVTRFYSQSVRPGLRVCLLKPYSGKTHQLRVALKSLSAPIVGDINYGGSPSDRVYLHAFQINFLWLGKRKKYSCLPEQQGLFDEMLSCINVRNFINTDNFEW